jgi:transcriptional regulator with XRE-family HTH domain
VQTLYGVSEIAEALGVSRGLVSQWVKRGKLPPPDAELAIGKIWTARRIEPWISRRLAAAPSSARSPRPMAPPARSRRALLRVLLADSDVRADLIRQFYERDDTRSLADVLMDLESDDVLRVTVIGLLEELEQP